MRLWLALALMVLIHAEGPLPADPRPAIAAARALAEAMGCTSPRVAVAWRGWERLMEITVECRDPLPTPTPEDK